MNFFDDLDTPNTAPGLCPECGKPANIWAAVTQQWCCCFCNWRGRNPNKPKSLRLDQRDVFLTGEKTMRTVYIARQESAATVERVRKLLDDLKWGPDINFQGLDFELERDDYTWVDWSDKLNGTALLCMVQDIVSGTDAE